MTKFVLAAVLALGLATVAYARDFTVSACTADKTNAVLAAGVDETIAPNHPVVEHIREAFTKTANTLSFQALVGDLGFYTFVDLLHDEDIASIVVLEVPKAVGSCK